MLKVLARRLIRYALYVAFFLVLFLVFNSLARKIIYSLPSFSHCSSGFDCFNIELGLLLVDLVISEIVMAITLYRYLEQEHHHHKQKRKRKRKPVSEKSV